MSDKYIIRNCPAYDYDEEFDYHICKQPLVPYECSVDDCQDCTDCVMKQVVELCKENLNSLETYVDIRSLECVTLQNILKLLDVQEVE